MRQFGLIGFPLSHSFSQKYFTGKFEKEGIKDCSFTNFPLASIKDFPALLKSHPLLEGINVTIPYKEQVLTFLSEQTSIVKEIKACNCIKIRKGKLYGHNTDVTGLEQSLMKHLLPSHTHALILGSGGAGKAVEYVLKNRQIKYNYVSRKPSYQSLSYEQLDEKIIRENTLIINTTPLGMYPNITQAPPIPYQFITRAHYLFDAIYNPEKTLFLQKGEAQEATIQNGHDMLVIQAEESWRIWNED